MEKKPEGHLQDLLKQLKSLQSAKARLIKKPEIENIIEMIRIRNGWTTIAEFLFAQGIARSLTDRINQLNKDIDAFHAAADNVK